MRTIATFLTNDFKNIRREYMLFYILIIPVIMITFLHIVLPLLSEWTVERFGFPLSDYYPLLLSFFVVIEIPFLFGVLYGLLLLDEKDEHILTVLRVTPVSLEYYLRYRFTVIVVLSMLFVTIGLPLTGVLEPMHLTSVLGVSFVGGLGGALLTLIMISYAGNKLEGLALMKGFGIMMIAPMGGYFTDSPLNLLLGIFPAYWPAKAFWLLSQGQSSWYYLLIGAIYISGICFLLYRRFQSRIGRSI